MGRFSKAYIDMKKDILKKQKTEWLMAEGLYYKEYSRNGFYTEEYPFSEVDKNTRQTVYFKYIVEEVSDEEFEEMKRLKELTDPPKEIVVTESFSVVGAILKIIGWVTLVLGSIIGVLLGKDFGFGVGFAVAISSIVSGVFVLGFAEIIKLLNDIKNKLS